MAAAMVIPGGTFFAGQKKPKFRMSLNPGMIGAIYSQEELVEVAAKYGFKAITPIPSSLGAMDDAQLARLLDRMKQVDITWESTNLPVDFRVDEARYREDLLVLPQTAKIVERAGGSRMNTWIMPTHATHTYLENFRQHTRRLREAAIVLGHHGIRLGLEYVGPKTLMARDKFSFIRTMAEAKELIGAIDEPNVGLVLDSFHWYCAGETQADILTLKADDVVTVDLNDARTGLERDQQIDGRRELPLATGVIPLAEFLQGLVDIGYDGPIRAEPFNQALRDMDDDDAVQATYDAMRDAFDLVSA